ncbi:MAG: putative DNA binding domain-containing protein [Planctomycetes bacterium]|nr:putative DNA binding domain-containing protein [Planctomycetota bacterium]
MKRSAGSPIRVRLMTAARDRHILQGHEMELDIATLLTEIAAGEDTRIEFKEILFHGDQVRLGSDPGKASRELAEVLVSMANTQGGKVVLGVTRDGVPSGVATDRRDLLEQLVVNAALQGARPAIEPTLDWVHLPGPDGSPKSCLVVEVSPARYYVHQTTDGRFLKRIGSHRHPIPAEQLGRLLAERGLTLPFEERPTPGTPMTAIDEVRVDRYLRQRFGDLGRIDPADRERWLLNLKLAIRVGDGPRPTNLGVLLFAEAPDRWLGGSFIDIASYRTPVADGDTADSKRVVGPLPEQLDQVLRYLKSSPLIATVSRKEAFGRRDLPAYVDTALQEAVVNAVVHRDYEITGSQILVRLFPDRVEIQNPGGLHNTLTEENLYAGCQPIRRNQLLAGFLRDYVSPITGTSFMESRGEGFLNLVRDSERLSGRRPVLRRIGQAVRLTIFGAQHEA